MTLRFHEIAEHNHQIQNPFSDEKLMKLAEICQLNAGTRLLDLACGKGELLCRWAQAHHIKGVGVEISETFIAAAHERANDLDVWAQVNFVVSDAGDYPQEFHQYDVVSCVGATWIGGGLVGTLNLMRTALKSEKDGLLLVGDIFWRKEPSDEVCKALKIDRDYITNLGGISDRFDEAGVELLEMMISSHDDWDRYYAKQWMTASQWLLDNPDDPDHAAFRQWITHHRQTYLKYEREYLGWGVFVLRCVP